MIEQVTALDSAVINARKTATPLVVPRGLLLPRAQHPSPGEYLGACAAALGGTLLLTAPLAVVGVVFGWVIPLTAWVGWLGLGVLMSSEKPSNLLARGIGSRTPTASELDVLRHALVRVCGAGGCSPDAFSFRVAAGETNAYSAGRDVIAVTEDLITGMTALEQTELEAVIAHELGHHQHGDSRLAGALTWYLLPLRIIERAFDVVALVPVVGRLLALLPRIALWLVIIPIQSAWLAGSTGREFLADRFAADCGYAIPLERLFQRLSQYQPAVPAGIVGVLAASHPPLADRIARMQDTVSNSSEAYRNLVSASRATSR